MFMMFRTVPVLSAGISSHQYCLQVSYPIMIIVCKCAHGIYAPPPQMGWISAGAEFFLGGEGGGGDLRKDKDNTNRNV